MAERKPTAEEQQAFLEELARQGQSSLVDPVPGALAQLGPAVSGGPAAIKAAALLDALGIGRAGEDVMQGMTWRGGKKSKGIFEALKAFTKRNPKYAEVASSQVHHDPSMEQLPKFLKQIRAKYEAPIQREEALEKALSKESPDPEAIRLAQAFWEARRPGAARSTRELELAEDVSPTIGRYGWMHPSRFAKTALESGAPKPLIKSGNIGINPGEERVNSILDAVETLTHEGGHQLQFRRADFDPNWYDMKKEMEVYPKGPRESQAFKMGFRGTKDFKEFMKTLLTRKGANEPILRKALDEDPVLVSLIESLETRYKLKQMSKQEINYKGARR